MGQSRISTHLASLKRAGSGARPARGQAHLLWVDPGGGQRRTAHRSGGARSSPPARREIPESATDRTALGLVLRKREDRAREYFNRLAGRFGRSYCPGRSWQGLGHMLLKLLPPMVIADLGAGEGHAFPTAGHQRRTGSSPWTTRKRWLNTARTSPASTGLKTWNIGWATSSRRPSSPAAWTSLFSARRSTTPASPRAPWPGAQQILKPGGRLVILDLLSHHFEQARELYADLWLGFSELELHQLLEGSGFEGIDVSVVSREEESPHLQTILATGLKKAAC